MHLLNLHKWLYCTTRKYTAAPSDCRAQDHVCQEQGQKLVFLPPGCSSLSHFASHFWTVAPTIAWVLLPRVRVILLSVCFSENVSILTSGHQWIADVRNPCLQQRERKQYIHIPMTQAYVQIFLFSCTCLIQNSFSITYHNLPDTTSPYSAVIGYKILKMVDQLGTSSRSKFI